MSRDSRVYKLKHFFADFDKFYFSPLFIKDKDRIARRLDAQRQQIDDAEWRNNSVIQTESKIDELMVSEQSLQFGSEANNE
jgi:hypothetical protein